MKRWQAYLDYAKSDWLAVAAYWVGAIVVLLYADGLATWGFILFLLGGMKRSNTDHEEVMADLEKAYSIGRKTGALEYKLGLYLEQAGENASSAH